MAKITLFDFAAKGMKAQAEIDKLCRTNDPETSHKAAEKMVDSGKLAFQENNVYEAICHFIKYYQDDFTAKDIASRTNITYYTAQRRFSSLHRKGKIERIQRTVTTLRKTYKVCISKSGKPAWVRRNGCCVWRLVK